MKKAWRILKKVIFWLFLLQFIYIIFCRWINPPLTLTQAFSLIHGYGLHRDYVSFAEMNSSIKLAVMASEDQLFPDHNGFDIKAIKKAMKYNSKHVTKVRGGSTISQQVAKNVFLWQGKSLVRKGLEVYFTFMIETIWNKKRILETYLNVAEMGKGIFGVQAAAKTFFNKDAKDLTRAEAAMIAAALPNPKVYSIKPMSAYVARRYPEIMHQMDNLEGDDAIDEITK